MKSKHIGSMGLTMMVALFCVVLTGCKEEKAETAEAEKAVTAGAAKVEKAAAEHPAAKDAPKDHPAH